MNMKKKNSLIVVWLWSGAVLCHALTAELPLGVCRNGRAFFQVGRLLIADAPGRDGSIFILVESHRDDPEVNITFANSK